MAETKATITRAKAPGGAVARRGRPRSAQARRKVLSAARRLLEEGGVAAVTMEAVAARAGVGKPTIYRTWPNALAVAMAALLDQAPEAEPLGADAGLRALRAQLRRTIAAFSTPVGRNAAALIAAADQNTEIAKAFRNGVILASRTEGLALLAEAAAGGEIEAGMDLEAAADMVYGAVFFRLLLGHQPLTPELADALVDRLQAQPAKKG